MFSGGENLSLAEGLHNRLPLAVVKPKTPETINTILYFFILATCLLPIAYCLVPIACCLVPI
jgi:hypothetical protein